MKSRDTQGVKIGFPSRCPITGDAFFMLIEHPVHGVVPTYGGAFDSYTIPEREEGPDEGFLRQRFDHDAGTWIDGFETCYYKVRSTEELEALEYAIETQRGEIEALRAALAQSLKEEST